MKLHALFALTLGLVAVPVAAQTATPAPAAATPAPTTAAPVIKSGDLVWSVDGGKIGNVDSVRGADAAVVTDERIVLIPVATLRAGPHGLVTSLSRKEINRL